MTQQLAYRHMLLCKHPPLYVALFEEHTKLWQFCLRCGAYRRRNAFQDRVTDPERRVPWNLPDLLSEALKEPT